MLWLALYLPWLPLEALLTDDPAAHADSRGAAASPAFAVPGDGAAAALCVIDERCVLAATRAARAAGVEPGMSSSTAASLAPQVLQRPRQPQREADFVHALALALGRYTPRIVLQADGVWLEVQGSLRLFGGVRALLAQVQATARACGAHARLAVAPTALGAGLLARTTRRGHALRGPRLQRLLDALPLAPALVALQVEPRLAQMLQTIGCRSLADVRALPRAGLSRRGGTELLHALALAYGQAPDAQAWFEPPERFAMSLELMHRADDAAQLVFAAQRLVQPLAGWLTRQWLAAARLTLQLRHDSTRQRAVAASELRIELGAPSREAAQILLLLRERLQRHVLAAPVYAIELHLDEAVSHAGSAGELLPDPGRQAQAFQALLDRLASRLGAERVLRLSAMPDHRPERASQARAANAPPSFPTPAPTTATTAATARPHGPLLHPQPRPLWLLPEPLRLREHDGQPVHGSPLVLRSRAERIEAGWFDGQLVCRDYHVAEGADHRLRWIYRERPAHNREAAWYLHGLFA
jgi:protein ImuB